MSKAKNRTIKTSKEEGEKVFLLMSSILVSPEDPRRLGGGGDGTMGSKIVTFKDSGVKKRRHSHRRSKSLPSPGRNIDVPFSPPKLLSEEVKELHKKKVILDTGIPELKGWTNKKEKDKLKGAVATVLDEKRKEQLATIQKRY